MLATESRRSALHVQSARASPAEASATTILPSLPLSLSVAALRPSSAQPRSSSLSLSSSLSRLHQRRHPAAWVTPSASHRELDMTARSAAGDVASILPRLDRSATDNDGPSSNSQRGSPRPGSIASATAAPAATVSTARRGSQSSHVALPPRAVADSLRATLRRAEAAAVDAETVLRRGGAIGARREVAARTLQRFWRRELSRRSLWRNAGALVDAAHAMMELARHAKRLRDRVLRRSAANTARRALAAWAALERRHRTERHTTLEAAAKFRHARVVGTARRAMVAWHAMATGPWSRRRVLLRRAQRLAEAAHMWDVRRVLIAEELAAEEAIAATRDKAAKMMVVPESSQPGSSSSSSASTAKPRAWVHVPPLRERPHITPAEARRLLDPTRCDRIPLPAFAVPAQIEAFAITRAVAAARARLRLRTCRAVFVAWRRTIAGEFAGRAELAIALFRAQAKRRALHAWRLVMRHERSGPQIGSVIRVTGRRPMRPDITGPRLERLLKTGSLIDDSAPAPSNTVTTTATSASPRPAPPVVAVTSPAMVSDPVNGTKSVGAATPFWSSPLGKQEHVRASRQALELLGADEDQVLPPLETDLDIVAAAASSTVSPKAQRPTSDLSAAAALARSGAPSPPPLPHKLLLGRQARAATAVNERLAIVFHRWRLLGRCFTPWADIGRRRARFKSLRTRLSRRILLACLAAWWRWATHRRRRRKEVAEQWARHRLDLMTRCFTRWRRIAREGLAERLAHERLLRGATALRRTRLMARTFRAWAHLAVYGRMAGYYRREELLRQMKLANERVAGLMTNLRESANQIEVLRAELDKVSTDMRRWRSEAVAKDMAVSEAAFARSHAEAVADYYRSVVAEIARIHPGTVRRIRDAQGVAPGPLEDALAEHDRRRALNEARRMVARERGTPALLVDSNNDDDPEPDEGERKQQQSESNHSRVAVASASPRAIEVAAPVGTSPSSMRTATRAVAPASPGFRARPAPRTPSVSGSRPASETGPRSPVQRLPSKRQASPASHPPSLLEHGVVDLRSTQVSDRPDLDDRDDSEAPWRTSTAPAMDNAGDDLGDEVPIVVPRSTTEDGSPPSVGSVIAAVDRVQVSRHASPVERQTAWRARSP